MFKHLSLFSGIGGFDLAAQWMGWENVAHCEKDAHCQKVLKKNFPNTILHEDITKTDFTIYRGLIDVLTGGFPCQDISVASSNGKSGLKGVRSGLWYEMLRAIRETKPYWVVCENVYGLVNQDGGLAIETVCSGLENEGYEVFPPLVIPALATGANHLRKRVWIIAHAIGERNWVSKEKIQTRRNFIEYSDWWYTEPEICRVYDGLPAELDKNRLKGLGNAIRPQNAFQIFKTIEDYNSQTAPQ